MLWSEWQTLHNNKKGCVGKKKGFSFIVSCDKFDSVYFLSVSVQMRHAISGHELLNQSVHKITHSLQLFTKLRTGPNYSRGIPIFFFFCVSISVIPVIVFSSIILFYTNEFTLFYCCLLLWLFYKVSRPWHSVSSSTKCQHGYVTDYGLVVEVGVAFNQSVASQPCVSVSVTIRETLCDLNFFFSAKG